MADEPTKATGFHEKQLMQSIHLLLLLKKLLREKGIDPKAIQGTGRAGRITKEDALQAIPCDGNQT